MNSDPAQSRLLQTYQEASRELPIPPTDFVRYVCGHDDQQQYLASGWDVFTMLDLACRRYGQKPIEQYKTVLDFGCGAGRLLQYIPFGPQVVGVDVSRPIVSWARENFPNTELIVGSNDPPLDISDGSFDLVYSFSVFSHLLEDREMRWLAELARVGTADCLYLITVHGDWIIEATLGEERAVAESAGFYYREVHQRGLWPRTGSSLEFPPGYEATYHSSDHIRRAWSELFDVVAIIDGRDPTNYLFDDLAFSPDGDVRLFAPMGQDLVVLRKRS